MASMVILKASHGGGLDVRSQSIAALTAKANGDDVGYLVALGCPRNMAIRSVAHSSVQRELPHGDADTLYRVGEQRALVNGYTPSPENRSETLSTDELARRVAAVGRQVAADKLIPEWRTRVERRGHCDSCDDPTCGGVTADDLFDDELEEN